MVLFTHSSVAGNMIVPLAFRRTILQPEINNFCDLQYCKNQQQDVNKLVAFTTSLHHSGYLHTTLYKECTSIYASGSRTSGVYPIWLKERFQFTYVYCDMDLVSTKKGWTTIQRRMNGEVNFERGWDDYVRGFGNPSSEYWLGLKNIRRLSRQTAYANNGLGAIYIQDPEVAFNLEDWDGVKAFVQYKNFKLNSNAPSYWLNVYGLKKASTFSITPIYMSEFSTPDRDNDYQDRHCASDHKSGWWFHYCDEANLNGPYPKYKQEMTWKNIYWDGWNTVNPNNTALRFVSMELYHGMVEL
ncbi:fibrinogen-like protein 1 [Clavelina lepadiformis]|uniref:fibrinogen-like protein 1 n=1 Tax=Clavelina lepadiformis TaxID=159417 RepID=UPI0040439383